MQNRILPGILLTIFAGFCFSTMDAFGKALSLYLPVVVIVWGRYLTHTMLTGSILLATHGPRFLRTRRPLAHILRGLAMLGATLLMYTALARVPLADATSALFLTPILVALFSALFLKERIGLHRSGAFLAGFAGVLLIVRPGGEGVSIYHLLPLGAACLNATYLILTSLLAVKEERLAAQFYTTGVGSVVLSFAVTYVWQTPGPLQIASLLVMGLLGTAGHSSLVIAMRFAPASLLSPYLYSQVLGAMVISTVWFGDALPPSTLAGTVLLVVSGVYIWWREQVVRGRR